MIRSRILACALMGTALAIAAGDVSNDEADAASGYLTACCSQTVTLSLEWNIGNFSWSIASAPAMHYQRVWNGSGVLLLNSYTSVSGGWSAGGCACYRQSGIKRDGAASVTDLVWQVA